MSARTPVLRGVVVGPGVMGSNHLRVLRGMAGVRFAAVVDPDPTRRANAASGEAGVGGAS